MEVKKAFPLTETGGVLGFETVSARLWSEGVAVAADTRTAAATRAEVVFILNWDVWDGCCCGMARPDAERTSNVFKHEKLEKQNAQDRAKF